MWEVLVRTPRGRNNPRKLSMLLATFFVAVFGYISLTTPIASAATDATWNGDNISYQGNTYSPVAADATLPVDIPSGSTAYQFTDQTQTPNLVYFIFFSAGTDNPKSAKEATYIRYTLNPPNSYINPNGKKTITLKPSEASASPKASDGTLSSSCTISGIGWIVCPLMNGISEGMDFIYARIEGFLSVQPITTSVNNPIYRIWMYSRDLANVAFIIAFLVIIYSYLVGGGFSGYEIRKILPRIILVAVLINVSYIICAAAVDMSNIAGHSVNQLFETVRDNALPGSAASGNVNWTSVTTWVLAGGSGAVASALILPGAVGGLGGLWLMLSTFLLGAVLVVMVTFLILAARQAIIIVLIAIAPLAFAAYVLPNTEKWFDKWKDLFFTMLIMFPAFGAVFGGAQLAGDLIIRMAVANGSIEQIILGLGVMVAPLAITPLLLKLSGGVLGRVGGLINNRQKGVYDRFKNHNEERRQQLIDRHRALNAERRINGDFGGGRFNPRTMVRRRAATNYARRNYREEQQKQDQEAAKNSWHRQNGRWGYDNHFEHDNFAERTNARNRIGFRQDGFGNLDTYMRRNAGLHDLTEAEHEEHWQNRLNGAAGAVDRAMLTDSRMAQGRAKVISGAFEAQDERALRTAIHEANTPQYAQLRQMQVQSTVDSSFADALKGRLDTEGKLAFKQEFTGATDAARALRRAFNESKAMEKEIGVIDTTLEKRAEAHWERTSVQDDRIRNLRLQAVEATDSASKYEEQWNKLIANIRAEGASAPGITLNADKTAAGRIKQLGMDIQYEKFGQEAAQRVTQANMSKTLKSNSAIRAYAGGIGGEEAANRIYAKAKSDIVQAYLDDVKASRSVLSEHSIEELLTIHQTHHDPRTNVDVTEAMVDAAMQEIVLTKGNNWSFQKTKDYIASRGMYYNEDDRKYYNDFNFSTGEYLNEITDQKEIDRRRDEQQLFVDSVNNSKLKIKSLSGTDRGNMETGTFTLPSDVAIIRDIRDKKINAQRLAETDIDELMRTVQVLRIDERRSSLTEDQRLALINTIEYATDRNHPEISGNIGTREREMMNVIAEYLRHNEDVIPMDEKVRIEETTQTTIPTNYDPTKFYKPSAAAVGPDRGEPYGPNGRTDKRERPE